MDVTGSTPARERAWPEAWPEALPEWSHAALVAAFCALVFLFALGTPAITSVNEGLYGQVAREMLETGDWIVPHVNGVVYFEKPPLMYWLVALSLRIFGENAWAARLPSSLAAIGTVWLVFWVGARRWGRASGAFAAATFATSLGFIVVARQVMFDSLLTFFVTLSMVAFWSAWRSRRSAYLYVAYLGLAGAVMTKGLIGLAVPGLVLVVYFLLRGERQHLWFSVAPGPLLVFLALAVPWHVAAQLRDRRFVWFYFINEHVLRFLGRRQPADFHVSSPWTALVAAPALMFPWTALVAAAIAHSLEIGWEKARWRVRQWYSDELYPLCWLLVPVVFFTFSRSFTGYYLLPALPALALLMGKMWEDMGERPPGSGARSWFALPLAISFALVTAGWWWCGQHAAGDTLAARRCALAFAALWPLAAGLGASAAVAWTRRLKAAVGVLLVAFAVTWIVMVDGFTRYSPAVTEQPFAEAVELARPAPGAVVAMHGRLDQHSSFVYHLPRQLRPVFVVEGRKGGDLEFGSEDPAVRNLFVSREQLAAIASSEELFYLTDDPPRIPVPDGMRVLLRDGDSMVWTNAPARTGRNDSVPTREGTRSPDSPQRAKALVPKGSG